MAENEIENGELEQDSGAPDTSGGKQSAAGGLLGRLKEVNTGVLVIFPVVGVLAAVIVGMLMFGGREQKRQPSAAVDTQPVAESSTPLIASSRAMEIAEQRSRLRRSNRSERNQHLTQRLGEDDLYNIAVRGELSLISGMFDHYVTTTARFYELFRIMANDYVENSSQMLALFEDELLPDYNATERRRRMLRRRVEHDPAVELYNRLDYIAYHDSIAVSSFHQFLTEGGADKFASTSELVSNSKFMIGDFRKRLQARLEDFGMTYDIQENLWDRYYGAWPW